MKNLILLFYFLGLINTVKSQNVFGFAYYTNEEDSVIVTQVFKNSPADKAGLKVGDFLNFINDIPFSFKKKEILAKVLNDAPNVNNELRFYRAPNVLKTIIQKAPLNSFEFTCISGNCTNGECVVESTYGYTIKGKCSDNSISGAAECYLSDGSLYYKGNLLNNKFEGNGTQYASNKSIFEGIFKNGLRNGNGKITYPDNSYLTGSWKEDKIEGNAQYYDANTKQTSNRVYKNGKLEQETKTNALTDNNSSVKPISTNTELNKVKKDPATTLKILEAKSGYFWSTQFFSEKYPNSIPKKQMPPFEKSDFKTLASSASLTPETLKLVVEQCAYENWPSFYKTYSDINTLFKFAFRNLSFEKVLTFKTDKDNGEYKRYGDYTIIFIRNISNKHAPKEMLSDDGIGFFMCVDAEITRDFMNPAFNYTPFTIEQPFKGGGFGNWQSKKEVYIQDMKSIEDKYYNAGYNFSNKELQTSLGLTDDEFKKLTDLCDAQNRPDGLKTTQQIIDAQRNAIFVDMKVYQLGNLGTTYLLYVPKNENYHLAQNMQPKSSEGWYFCTKSNVSINKPDASYISSIKATTDAAMEQYRKEQAEREQKNKEELSKYYEWAEKNKFKGVCILQYKGNTTNYDVSDDELIRVVSVFGPPDQIFSEKDRLIIEEKYQSVGWELRVGLFNENMDESQAIKYLTEVKGYDRFSINTNYSYTIPKRTTKSFTEELNKIDAEIDKNQQEINKLYKELIDSNTIENTEQIINNMTNTLSGTNKEIPRNTNIVVVAIDNSNKNYNQLKDYIGKQGTTKTLLKPNNDGSYTGMIEFFSDFNIISFEKVTVKIIP